MINRHGPFQIIDSEAMSVCQASVANAEASENSAQGMPSPLSSPRRRYNCKNYATCLNLAAALNWDNFTCRGCSGEIDESLYWRARQAMKKDTIVQTLCEIPEIAFHKSEEPAIEPLVHIVTKR